MAAELERFLGELLTRLPEDHPDRHLLTGLSQVVDAYTEQRAESEAVPLEESSFQEVLPAADRPTEPTAAEQAKQDEQERLTIRGRVGAPPRFRTTRKNIRIGQFNLAEHQDDDTTRWHTVLSFGARADRLERQHLARGQQVEVVGYRHERQARGRDGAMKLVEEIYAVAVKTS